ncbi:hypothetical protein [Myxococcus faecalis]|uniref:hypothetical protein n=1 Tax=Myxococcus faecalis TaxID=3115646 RepID=UPI003CF92EA4
MEPSNSVRINSESVLTQDGRSVSWLALWLSAPNGMVSIRAIEQDDDAVGVDGRQVTEFKLLKRQMHDLSNFDRLRLQVIITV